MTYTPRNKKKHESERSFPVYFKSLTRKLAFKQLAAGYNMSMTELAQAEIEAKYGDKLDRIERQIIIDTMRANGKVIEHDR